jgi:hypothetical protein
MSGVALRLAALAGLGFIAAAAYVL